MVYLEKLYHRTIYIEGAVSGVKNLTVGGSIDLVFGAEVRFSVV